MRNRNFFLILVIAVILIFLAQSNGADPRAATDDKAEKILRQMSEYLDSLEQFTFHAEDTVDDILATGQQLQYGRSVDVFVRRPDRLRANVNGDLISQELFYDGKTITLVNKKMNPSLNRKLNYYASLEAPPTIEEAFEYARKIYSLDAPLADIVLKNSYELLKQEIMSSLYVGLHRVHGVECHHLAFSQEDVDWQIWIENSDTPLPKKLVITEKWVTGQPQFTALLSKWNINPKLKDSVFVFEPPKDLLKIDFLPTES